MTTSIIGFALLIGIFEVWGLLTYKEKGFFPTLDEFIEADPLPGIE